MEEDEVLRREAVDAFLRSVRASREETDLRGPVPSAEVARSGDEAIARGLDRRVHEERAVADAKLR